jgi:2-iminobutanoate/2-iminopropanoate deaminase
MTHLVVHVPPGHSKPIGRYSPAVSTTIAAGDRLIHVSGQVATDHQGNVLCREDPGGQAEVVFERLRETLAAAGASLADILSVTIFLADRAYFPAVSAVRNRVFQEHAPASTLIIASMMESGCLVEINAVAIKRAT